MLDRLGAAWGVIGGGLPSFWQPCPIPSLEQGRWGGIGEAPFSGTGDLTGNEPRTGLDLSHLGETHGWEGQGYGELETSTATVSSGLAATETLIKL